MRGPAPPYDGEGPFALWHVSENPRITRFEPRTGSDGRARVWAVDTRHLPPYWFPRDCPRGTFWADPATTAADRDAYLGAATRVHAIQQDWVNRFDRARLVAYRVPEETFAPHPDVGGYWVSSESVEAGEVAELIDLGRLHHVAGIPLLVVPHLSSLWQQITSSSLEFSGMRLRNLAGG